MTPDLLRRAMLGITAARAQAWADPLTEACALFDIGTPIRQADFIAQIGHESGALQWVVELWGPNQVPAQRTYERDFSMPWGPSLKRGDRNFKAYTLGNFAEGDGFRYRGRGPIQNTGRGNYAKLRDDLRAILPAAMVPDFEVDPDALKDARWGALAAGNYWKKNGLNQLADSQDFGTQTERINGGRNGWADRVARRGYARKALGVQA